MLQSALEKEVDDFLGRRRYERTDEQRGYRNGHLPKRTIGVGMGAGEVSLPAVSEVRTQVSPSGVHAGSGASDQRRSRTQERRMVGRGRGGVASGRHSERGGGWEAGVGGEAEGGAGEGGARRQRDKDDDGDDGPRSGEHSSDVATERAC